MNILILHSMGHPRTWLQAVADLELSLPRYATGHNFIIHNTILPIPDFIKDVRFHGIILGPTFLCARYDPNLFDFTLKEFEFIKYVDAFKIALPQDDYDCSALLDQWVTDWRIDKVYTVCQEHWEVLYPGYLKSKGNLSLGYTGYISERLIQRCEHPRQHKDRPIDVCYRAKKLLPNFGRIGVIKGSLGERFKEEFKDLNLTTDISNDDKHIIPGNEWLEFIENAKFTLGSNSGSSLLDPMGKIRSCINAYIAENPNASFEEIETACFPGQDGKYVFTAISPRVFEAGLLKTGQILTPGQYSGILEPWVHYLPLYEDFSNKHEIAKAIKDIGLLEKLTSACKKTLLSDPRIWMDTHVTNLLSDIEEGIRYRNILSDTFLFRKAMIQYKTYIATVKSKDAIMFWLQNTQGLMVEHFPIIRDFYRHIRRLFPKNS